ncbi:acyl-CoA dehydrogenase family protein [Thermodesulfobacteriota bacterium]
MEIIEYDAQHRQFRRRLRTFIEKEVAPFADQWEKEHIVPKSVWRKMIIDECVPMLQTGKMGKEGFLCPCVSETYGGAGGDFRYALIVAEEMSRTRQTGLFTTLHSDVVVPYIDAYASVEQKTKYLPGCVSGDIITAVAMTEPGAGSDLAGMQTTAEEQGDEVVINGSKTFISNGINADLVIVAAKDPDVKSSHQAISLYLVESQTPGFKRGRQLEKMGWHSQDTAELFFSNCRIHKGNRLGEKGAGFLMMMEKLQQERLCAVFGAIPMAERILEWTFDHLRQPVANGKSLPKSQVVQFALVEMTTEVKLGRTFMEKLVADHIEGKNIVVETSMAKYWTTEMVNRVADRCLELLGNYGTLERCPVVRAKRDVRVLPIFAGTNEIMKSIAAKFMGL